MDQRWRHGVMAVALAAVAVLGVGSCQSDRSAPMAVDADASVAVTLSAGASAGLMAESPAARDRMADLRARFTVLGADVASTFEGRANRVHPVVPATAKRGVTTTASVELPLRARDAVDLEDDASHVAVSFALRGASDAALATTGGMAMYAGALAGNDIVHRVHAEGTEDFVVFESKPDRDELAYDVDVSRAAGLRLVGNTVEFLDEGGTPRLRVAPPYVVGADGVRREATLALEGCAYDTSAVGPWGRAITKPGAARCGVRVTWGGAGVVYPAMVDPAWTATGSMATARSSHTATLLASGKVLVAGGAYNNGLPVYLSSAELYDPTGSGTFAATGSMATTRASYTATLLTSGAVLVAGGYNGTVYLSSAELFDPTGVGSFTATGAMAVVRGGHTATLLGSGKVLVAGGDNGGTAELFDPTAASFAATGGLVTARGNHTATLLGSGKVLVLGGTSSVYLSSAELYDPAGAGSFAVTGAMATARAQHATTLLASGKVLVAGGYNGGGSSGLSSAELFDPTGAGSFAATGSMATTRRFHTATRLASGKVLVAAGLSNPNSLSTAELFDPAGAGTFGAVSAMAVGRHGHTATLLASGDVLLAGGVHFNTALSSALVFAPLAAGTACVVAGDCFSGVCEDGVCCAGPCGGTCMTCTAGTGVCVAVTSADDPDTCTGTSTCDSMGACIANTYCTTDAKCLGTHYCDANGRCQPRKVQGAACNQAAGADCRVAGCRDCASGNCVDAVCCDTGCTGSCVACTAALKGQGADGTCGNVVANSNPRNGCTPDPGFPANCKGDGKCDGSGACRTLAPSTVTCGATTCTANSASGRLCNGTGTCVPTTAVDCSPYVCASGACKTSCTADGDCITTAYCTMTNVCAPKKDPGAACAGDHECSNGGCVDGVCCNAACAGQCEACDVPGSLGTCSAVTGIPHGSRTACAGAGMPCGGSCDGTNRAACTNTPPTTLCATSCADGKEIDSTCDDHGMCMLGTAKACPGNLACSSSLECNTSCTKDSDCLTNFVCDGTGHCNPKGGSVCVDDHTVADSNGTKSPCDPYKCLGGACLQVCNSVDNCVAPAACNGSGACVAPPQGSGSSGGCSAAPARATNDAAPSLCALAILGLGLGARRRRRALVLRGKHPRIRS